MKYMYSFIILLAICVGVSVQTAQAQTPPTNMPTIGVWLGGYAWSSTIGWISMSCQNSSSCASDGGIDYGVVIQSDGTLDGYAWSPNVGWIKFGGLSSFPTGSGTTAANASADGDYATGLTLSGWARACAGTEFGDCSTMTSRTDGWDGWMSLSGSGYGISFSPGGAGLEADAGSYAWGSTVVGWTSFSTPFSSVSEVPPPVSAGPAILTPDALDVDECTLNSITPAPATTGVCDPINIEFDVKNDSGRDITAAETLAFEFEYRPLPSGSWTTFNTGTINQVIPDGAVITINAVLTAPLTFGAHEVRATIEGNSLTAPLVIDPFPVARPVPTPEETVVIGPPGNPYGTLSVGAAPSIPTEFVRFGTVLPIEFTVDTPLPMSCDVSGPGITGSITHDPAVNLVSTFGPVNSAPLESKSRFELECTPLPLPGFTPISTDVYTAIMEVEVIPSTQER